MEICGPVNKSACQDTTSPCGSSVDPQSPRRCNSGELSMSDLKNCLTEFQNIENIGASTSGIKSSYPTSEECDSKRVACLPILVPKYEDEWSDAKEIQVEDITAEASELNGSDEYENQCHHRSLSLATPLKLVSAMKGSREKQGIHPKKLSVSWSPEVYDPVPSSVSHVPSNKNYRREGKKSGKNKQKGGGSKSSRYSRGKVKMQDQKQDKKQAQKHGGISNKIKPLHDDRRVVGFSEPGAVVIDFDVGSLDPFCRSSFLKKSVAKLHYPVAEAT